MVWSRYDAGVAMLLVLFLLTPWIGVTAHTKHAIPLQATDTPSLALRPHIHYCRSPNMETFTCWWHFPGNGSLSSQNLKYTLTYTVGKGPKQECPDYVTGGVNSCYFDSHHTQVWEVYCMNVTVKNTLASYTSEEHCLDVADIVETDPPFNLTYWLKNSTGEMTHTAVVSWMYPIAADVQMGWVTLVYQLQFRRKDEPRDWKVKGVLREPRLELLDLPMGSYVVRVRCKSHNSGLWSKWSDPLTVDIPPTHSTDKMLALILVSVVGVTFLLVIGFGVTPHGKRIKAFLLPPIPKPQIRGIDPLLLKNGKIDEVARLFSSLHGYMPPQCSTESWLRVSVDEGLPFMEKREGEGPRNPPLDSPSPYCETPPRGPEESSTQTWPGPCPEYTRPLSPPPCHNFYTFVNKISSGGAVHLVPCPPQDINGTSEKVVDKKDKQVEPEMGGVASNPGTLAGGAGVNYTTLHNLDLYKQWGVGVAPTYRQEGPQEELATPLL
ncbi:hypothetical protein AGOR_G00217610 [Albula goreensis]|uniref:Fibronectin type-III domain-containing protein n=1 Tax=Albula goreensis TaxID=1534307 RepID=A0A8T3CRM0_9TELE|nr:hypothetical protein AGOR_G00217610 [Albula goreensis]